jgi:hypothetical protein
MKSHLPHPRQVCRDLFTNITVWWHSVYPYACEKLADTKKSKIRTCESKRNRQYKDQKGKMANNNLNNTTWKT